MWFPVAGLQNGGDSTIPSPDGLALVVPGGITVVQFLSYEGSFTAMNGPASGMISVDILVKEELSQVGQSLQLQGLGSEYADFSWAGPIANTRGAVNTGQTFGP